MLLMLLMLYVCVHIVMPLGNRTVGDGYNGRWGAISVGPFAGGDWTAERCRRLPASVRSAWQHRLPASCLTYVHVLIVRRLLLLLFVCMALNDRRRCSCGS